MEYDSQDNFVIRNKKEEKLYIRNRRTDTDGGRV